MIGDIPGNTRTLQLHAAAGLDPDIAVLAQERGEEIEVYVRPMKEVTGR